MSDTTSGAWADLVPTQPSGAWKDGQWVPATAPGHWQAGQWMDPARTTDAPTLPGLNQPPATPFKDAAKEFGLSLVPGYSTYHADEIPRQASQAWSSLKDGHPVSAAGYGALAGLGTLGVVGDGLVAASALDGPLAAVTAPAGEALKGISGLGRLFGRAKEWISGASAAPAQQGAAALPKFSGPDLTNLSLEHIDALAEMAHPYARPPSPETMDAIRQHLGSTPGLGDMTKLLTDANGNPVPIRSEGHAQQALAEMRDQGMSPYAPLTRAMGLETDKAAIQQRAAEGQFNYPGYHSTSYTDGPFTGFDDARLGGNTGAPSAKLGHFQATNPETTESYLGSTQEWADPEALAAARERTNNAFGVVSDSLHQQIMADAPAETARLNAMRSAIGLEPMPHDWSLGATEPLTWSPETHRADPWTNMGLSFLQTEGQEPVHVAMRRLGMDLRNYGYPDSYVPGMGHDDFTDYLKRLQPNPSTAWAPSAEQSQAMREFLDGVDKHRIHLNTDILANLDYARRDMSVENSLDNMHFPVEVTNEYPRLPEEHRRLFEEAEAAWPTLEEYRPGVTMPYRFRMDNPLEHDFKNQGRTESYADLMRQARANGQDGVVFRNTYDGGSHGTDINAILAGNAHQTRLQHAQYNPYWAHLNDNLAGYGAVAGTGAAAAATGAYADPTPPSSGAF